MGGDNIIGDEKIGDKTIEIIKNRENQ